MVEYKILLTEEERFNLVTEEYFEAVEYEDWEKVVSLIKLRTCIHSGRCRVGEGFFRQTRRVFAEYFVYCKKTQRSMAEKDPPTRRLRL